MVKKVIILFSLLLFPFSSYVHTLSIISGCVCEVYKVKSLTAAGGVGGYVVSENFFQQATLIMLLTFLFMNLSQNFCNLVPFSPRTCV